VAVDRWRPSAGCKNFRRFCCAGSCCLRGLGTAAAVLAPTAAPAFLEFPLFFAASIAPALRLAYYHGCRNFLHGRKRRFALSYWDT
jgi:hypothetical protein